MSINFFYYLSCSSYFFASSTNFSIYSSDNFSLSLDIVIYSDLPVLFSQADIFIIPLASTLKVTSIYGYPLGIGGIPFNIN